MGISREQALDCCQSDDLIGIGMEADAVRRQLHPEGAVTYVVDRSLSSTAPNLEVKIRETIDLGATGIVLLPSRQPAEPSSLASLEQALGSIKRQSPSLWLHGLSATEVIQLAHSSGVPVEDVLRRLQAAGLGSLSGNDAGILDAAVQTTDERCSPADWLQIHRAAHRLGLSSTATMLFGAGEALEHRVNHLEALRHLQQETGGFTAICPIAFRPTALDVPGFEEATAIEYLRMLAITRMFLPTIPNVEADWPNQGLKVLQMTLRFGVNDVGSVFPTESLTTPDGTTEEDLRRVIRGAGFRPVRRDTTYSTLFLD